ncbi:MAG: glycogen debranching N-terminal domain-containing protein [Candidatus Binatia bacterium]
MKRQKQTAHGDRDQHSGQGRDAQPHDAQSPEQKQERKDRVLTEGASSMARDIGDAIVMKDQNIFFLTNPDGNVPLAGQHGLGLYYHDCRFVSGYEMKLAGIAPTALVSTAAQGFMAVFQMTNPEIRMADEGLIRKDNLGIKWERSINSGKPVLHDLLEFQNFGLKPIEFPISLAFQAGFEDVFAVREMLDERSGKLRPPQWSNGVLTFVYEGADGLYRFVEIHFSPLPESMDETSANFHVTLQPKETKQLVVSLFIAESPDLGKIPSQARYQPDLKRIKEALQEDAAQWLSHHTEIRSDSLLLNNVMERSLRDLRVLRSEIGNQTFFAAGVPWFVTLFGRDSIVTALQTLAYEPAIAEQTLRLLASYQGQKLDPWRDEQPGKILHELRVGELARLGEIPHTPHYGTIDATILFLILLGRHAAWTGSLVVFNDLRSNIERALEWMSQCGDQNGDGYIEYQSESEKGLANQGWKDSGDAIVNDDGSLARPPISLVARRKLVGSDRRGF